MSKFIKTITITLIILLTLPCVSFSQYDDSYKKALLKARQRAALLRALRWAAERHRERVEALKRAEEKAVQENMDAMRNLIK